MKKVKNGLVWIVAIANMLTAIALLVCAYSDRVNPGSFPLMSICGLAFPYVLSVNLLFLVLWLLFYWRGVVIPIAVLLLSLPAIRLYWPINTMADVPDGAIKVMSYNVLMYAPWELQEGDANPIVTYILESNADIVCLQEASSSEADGAELDAKFKRVYPYRDVTRKGGGEWMTLLSKFPILSKDTLTLNSRGNMSVAYILDIHGEKTMVINNHLETVGLSFEEKDQFKRMVNYEMSDEETTHVSGSLIRKLAAASVLRAEQAEKVAKVVKESIDHGQSVIVCGDFNDSPISYTHRTISKQLTDCYVASGNGPGYTYQQNGMNFRIDYVLCSDDWTPCGAQVDKKVTTSDHFPVVG